nr:hypothetical protein [Ardenticatenales bacterium]
MFWLNRFFAVLMTTLLLAGCGLPWETPPPEPALTTPLATLPPTRGALLTSTLAAPFTAPPPSATPDLRLLSEQFVAPSGVLAFRYPPGWSVTDHSEESELLLQVQSPAGGTVDGLLIVNLLNVAGDIAPSQLPALADSYLRNFFSNQFDAMIFSYREEGDALIATTVSQSGGEAIQFEIRFAPRPPFYQVLTLIAAEAAWAQAAPILDGIARSVAVNPAQSSALPTPAAATTRQGMGLSVQNGSLYLAPTGSLYLVGEVLNESMQGYEDVQVAIALLDSAGAPLSHETWRAQRKVLPAGERSPLLVIFNQTPTGWASFRATVDALPANFYARRITTAFEVSNVVGSTPTFGAYALSGQLTGKEEARFIEITGTLYDAEGRVLAVETSTVEQDVL